MPLFYRNRSARAARCPRMWRRWPAGRRLGLWFPMPRFPRVTRLSWIVFPTLEQNWPLSNWSFSGKCSTRASASSTGRYLPALIHSTFCTLQHRPRAWVRRRLDRLRRPTCLLAWASTAQGSECTTQSLYTLPVSSRTPLARNTWSREPVYGT